MNQTAFNYQSETTSLYIHWSNVSFLARYPIFD